MKCCSGWGLLSVNCVPSPSIPCSYCWGRRPANSTSGNLAWWRALPLSLTTDSRGSVPLLGQVSWAGHGGFVTDFIYLLTYMNNHISALPRAGCCSRHLTLTPRVVLTIELIPCIGYLLAPHTTPFHVTSTQTTNMQALLVIFANILPC